MFKLTLTIKSKQHGKGRTFNRLVNNSWNRFFFFNNLKKWCNLKNVKFQEISPEYSSFVGQIQNPTDYDMVAASMEIGRRAYLFKSIFLDKTKKKIGIMFPDFNLNQIATHWKEMLGDIEGIKDWKALYRLIKNRNLSYRFLAKELAFLRFKSPQSFIGSYSYR